MAQQPNVEITDAERPRIKLEPGPAVKWRSDKPGMTTGPDDMEGGGLLGTTGPDPGWGLKLIAHASLPSDDERLREVVVGLTLARAASFGRAPVPEDVDVALALCGYGFDAPESVLERRERWVEAAAHDRRPGSTAVAEVDRGLLRETPARIQTALRGE